MNIEKTISEHAVSDILTPMLESQDRIVTEDVAPLFDQATGLDTPPASGTVTTTIEESRSVITAIIRKAWTAALTMLGGASVIGYITAAYTYLRNRLQGSETYGIPDRRSEISASSPLAANLALLNDRKIGGADCPDGMSLGRLLCDSSAAATVTEIVDDNVGWTMDKHILWSAFTNLQKIQLFCIAASKDMGTSLLGSIFSGTAHTLLIPELVRMTVTGGNKYFSGLINMANLTTLDADKLEYYEAGLLYGCNSLEEADLKNLKRAGTFVAYNCANLKRISADELETCADYSYYPSLIGNLPELQYASFKKVSSLNMNGTTGVGGTLQNMPKLEELHIGKCNAFSGGYAVACFSNCPMLIKLVIYGDLNTNINMAGWSPTLDSSNLQQFLQNFRDYIAKKLTDNGSGKTLTLSQAVFSEIWDSQGQPQVKGDGLDELRADIHRIIRTDKQWAVNKA